MNKGEIERWEKKLAMNTTNMLASDALGEILAIIFGDGGHRRSEIGDDIVAVKEAIKIVCDLRTKLDNVEFSQCKKTEEYDG